MQFTSYKEKKNFEKDKSVTKYFICIIDFK